MNKDSTESQLAEIRNDIQTLKNSVALLCGWISKQFGAEFPTQSTSNVISTNNLNFLQEPQHHEQQGNNPSINSGRSNPTKLDKSSRNESTQTGAGIQDITDKPNLFNTHPVSILMDSEAGTTSFSYDLNSFSQSYPFMGSPLEVEVNAEGQDEGIRENENFPDHDGQGQVIALDVLTNPAKPIKRKYIRKKRDTGTTPRTSKSNAQRGKKSQASPSSSPINDNGLSSTTKQVSVEIELIQCEVCGKFMKGPAAMKRHSQTHNSNRPHSCLECGKAFQRKFHLKTHQMIHSQERKHQCRFCGRLFLLPKDLVCHERTHTGEKPFPCELCPKRFNLKSHLVMHVRTHTKEKNYKCELCEKCFSQPNSLRVHKKIHVLAQPNPSGSEERQVRQVLEMEIDQRQQPQQNELSLTLATTLQPSTVTENGQFSAAFMTTTSGGKDESLIGILEPNGNYFPITTTNTNNINSHTISFQTVQQQQRTHNIFMLNPKM